MTKPKKDQKVVAAIENIKRYGRQWDSCDIVLRCGNKKVKIGTEFWAKKARERIAQINKFLKVVQK